MSREDRRIRLLPKECPRYVRCYAREDGIVRCFTIVFTGRYRQTTAGAYLSLQIQEIAVESDIPKLQFDWGESAQMPDRPSYAHLGKPVEFKNLPLESRQQVIQRYAELWGLESN